MVIERFAAVLQNPLSHCDPTAIVVPNLQGLWRILPNSTGDPRRPDLDVLSELWVRRTLRMFFPRPHVALSFRTEGLHHYP